jgi:peroxiredoxin
MAILLADALLVAIAAILVAYLLLRQHGRNLIALDHVHSRLAHLEEIVAASANGAPASAPASPSLQPLSIGTPAPAFSLPTLDGNIRRLNDFLGEELLVIFFNPQCGFCSEMAPALGHLSALAPSVLLISRGDSDEHRRMGSEHGWRCEVVLDQSGEVGIAYRTQATPTGYLIDRTGQIASRLAIGAEALLSIATRTASVSPPESQRLKQAEVARRARAAGLPVRDISESRINRNGLPAGTRAPDFELPDLVGGQRSLSSFRGKRVLLVFSDPQCAPCQELTPTLIRLHNQHTNNGLEVVMVSKGDPAEIRHKAEQHSITFPVLIQRASEIAKRYGSFATPVGYLIDESGTLESDLAVGTDAILNLAFQAS